MTGSDVIVLAPWVIFGAGLIVICLRLLRSRPPSRCPPAPSQAPCLHSKEPVRGQETGPRGAEQRPGGNQDGATS